MEAAEKAKKEGVWEEKVANKTGKGEFSDFIVHILVAAVACSRHRTVVHGR